ncbi:MAG TPA: ferric reductase-like protein [Anaerolineae bacterium]|nr:ferric reductase-like protein [Anaerolineae bacterium]
MQITPSQPVLWRTKLQALLGIIPLIIIFLLLLSPVGINLSTILVSSDKLSWYLTRASGVVAYLSLATSTVWGLLLSTKLVKKVVPAVLSLAMHTYLSWLAIGLVAFHAFVLLFDNYYTYSVANLLIPFTGPYKPVYVGLGIVAFYLMLLTSVSFYARRWIGQKNWRRLHYLTFAVYWLVTLHSWVAGTDSPTLTPIYAGSAILILFLTVLRIVFKI